MMRRTGLALSIRTFMGGANTAGNNANLVTAAATSAAIATVSTTAAVKAPALTLSQLNDMPWEESFANEIPPATATGEENSSNPPTTQDGFSGDKYCPGMKLSAMNAFTWEENSADAATANSLSSSSSATAAASSIDQEDAGDEYAGDAGDIITTLTEQFKVADADSSGGVDRLEFAAWYNSISKVPVSRKECDSMFDALDVDGSGALSLAEFLKIYKGDAALIKLSLAGLKSDQASPAAEILYPQEES